jgi:ubiquinone/menaquinone biosynthesis C-methylase UbiE
MKNLNFYDNNYLLKTKALTKKLKDRSYDLLHLEKGNVVVDLGCGNGYDTRMLANIVGQTGKVLGVDFDVQILQEACKTAEQQNIHNIEYIQADAEAIPLENNSCDAVRVERVFQHLKNPRKVMKEIRRILKPEGKIVIIETDWLGLHFHTPFYKIEQKIVNFLVDHKLNNGRASALLIDYIIGERFQDAQIEATPFVLSDYQAAETIIKLEDLILNIQDSNFIDKKELEMWKDTLVSYDELGFLRGSLNMLTVKANK